MSNHLQKVVIIGAGGFAREVLDTIDAYNLVSSRYDVLGYIVETPYGHSGTLIHDKPILGDFDWLIQHKDEVLVICGVGAPELRFRLVNQAQQMGVNFFNIIHPSVIRTKWMSIGAGSIVTAGCLLSNEIVIGNHVHVNPGSIIGHDVVLEDFVSLAPGVHVSGNVTLEKGCYIGTGASIIEKKTVHAWSILGAGTVAIHDVPPNSTVVGVPAKVISTRHAGWHTGS